jgi:hypothetical protein
MVRSNFYKTSVTLPIKLLSILDVYVKSNSTLHSNGSLSRYTCL